MITPYDINDYQALELPYAIFDGDGSTIEGSHVATMLDGRVAIQMDGTTKVYLCNDDFVTFEELT